MDTPIYAELQQKLIDPEATNWGPSAPPEFASSLAERTERTHGTNAEPTTLSSRSGRRHRAED